MTDSLAWLEEWYASVKRRQRTGTPKGTICGSLVVLERLKEDFDLDLDSHTAEGGSQIKGAGGTAAIRILESHGEHRPFAAEGGRTNRGLRGDIGALLLAIKSTALVGMADEERAAALSEAQEWLVGKAREHLNARGLKAVYNPSHTSRQMVHDLLSAARTAKKDGAVAQHLVGAKLQMRFGELSIENNSYSTADQQTGRSGDFQINDTVFHVTVSPFDALFSKCERNLDDGLRVFVLVPDRVLLAARQNAEQHRAGRISVEAIESFVSQNIEEIGAFGLGDVRNSTLSLLLEYNRRVDEVEYDKSLKVEIPTNLSKS